jgi:chaperonin cofactor prefoldin
MVDAKLSADGNAVEITQILSVSKEMLEDKIGFLERRIQMSNNGMVKLTQELQDLREQLALFVKPLEIK